MKTTDWILIFLSVCLLDIIHAERNNNLIQFHGINNMNLGRRYLLDRNRDVILGVPRHPEDLPRAEPILPGHTLLRPASGMLKSSVKYPLRDFGGAAVYGNEDNIGNTWGKTSQRIRYSDFRKANKFMSALQNAVQKRKMKIKESSRPMIVIELNPSEIEFIKRKGLQKATENQKLENEIHGSEVFDDLDVFDKDGSSEFIDLRRKSKKSKFRNRNAQYSTRTKSSEDSSSSSSSSETEKNPGNPFTVHKSKYKQNWMWNHKLDGDHMNINPYAPEINSVGPTGPELFYGRKWWYFNQDDYKPL